MIFEGHGRIFLFLVLLFLSSEKKYVVWKIFFFTSEQFFSCVERSKKKIHSWKMKNDETSAFLCVYYLMFSYLFRLWTCWYMLCVRKVWFCILYCDISNVQKHWGERVTLFYPPKKCSCVEPSEKKNVHNKLFFLVSSQVIFTWNVEKE